MTPPMRGACGIGFWRGQRPSVAEYVTGTRGYPWGARRWRALMLPSLSADHGAKGEIMRDRA
jgi:hypothetical protein